MSRYTLIRKAVDRLERASNTASRLTFGGVRAGVDWLEKRDTKAAAPPQSSSPRLTEPLNTDEAVDEAAEESFPASDPPAGWAGADSSDIGAGPSSSR